MLRLKKLLMFCILSLFTVSLLHAATFAGKFKFNKFKDSEGNYWIDKDFGKTNRGGAGCFSTSNDAGIKFENFDCPVSNPGYLASIKGCLYRFTFQTNVETCDGTIIRVECSTASEDAVIPRDGNSDNTVKSAVKCTVTSSSGVSYSQPATIMFGVGRTLAGSFVLNWLQYDAEKTTSLYMPGLQLDGKNINGIKVGTPESKYKP